MEQANPLDAHARPTKSRGPAMTLFLIIGAFLLSCAAAFAWICDERIIAGIYGAMAFACVFGAL
jgi:hypothetical protein